MLFYLLQVLFILFHFIFSLFISLDPKQNLINKKNFDQSNQLISSQNNNRKRYNKSTFEPIKVTTRSERGVIVKKPNKELPITITNSQSRKKVPLNESLKYCLDFVKELFNKKHSEYAWPFWEPVNIQNYPDYYQKIKHPIDLSTIKVSK